MIDIENGAEVLLVDSEIYSGGTMSASVDYIVARWENSAIRTLAQFYQHTTIHAPDYYADEVSGMTVMP